jgi:hypothetical protein
LKRLIISLQGFATIFPIKLRGERGEREREERGGREREWEKERVCTTIYY